MSPRALTTFAMLALLACDSPPPRPVVRVLAAASLADVIASIARDYELARGVDVELQLGASSTLAEQIAHGAECDVFLAADPRWTERVVAEGHATDASRMTFATNRLVVVVPASARVAPRTLGELASLAHVAVAGPEVPAGTHARASLSHAGVLDRVAPRFVVAADVRAALAWVARGEADAGIVYATDARADSRVRVAIEIAPEGHEPIRYDALAMSARGRELAEYLASGAARAHLAAAGFGAP